MLNKYDFEKLLDDIKLISKNVKIIRDENDETKRKFACGLYEDLINRLYRDIKEMKDGKDNNEQTYGGTINGGD